MLGTVPVALLGFLVQWDPEAHKQGRLASPDELLKPAPVGLGSLAGGGTHELGSAGWAGVLLVKGRGVPGRGCSVQTPEQILSM